MTQRNMTTISTKRAFALSLLTTVILFQAGTVAQEPPPSSPPPAMCASLPLATVEQYKAAYNWNTIAIPFTKDEFFNQYWMQFSAESGAHLGAQFAQYPYGGGTVLSLSISKAGQYWTYDKVAFAIETNNKEVNYYWLEKNKHCKIAVDYDFQDVNQITIWMNRNP